MDCLNYTAAPGCAQLQIRKAGPATCAGTRDGYDKLDCYHGLLPEQPGFYALFGPMYTISHKMPSGDSNITW